MKHDPERHRRRSIRLRGYDYSQSGIYFITLCTHRRQWLFGEIHNGQMILNQIGKIVAQEWLRSPEIRQEIALDAWVIMPDHLHGVVIIENDGGGAQCLLWDRGCVGRGGDIYDVVGRDGDIDDVVGRDGDIDDVVRRDGDIDDVVGRDGDIYDVGRKRCAPSGGSSGGVAHRKPRSLSSSIAGFKSSVTKRIKPLCYDPNPRVWQRNYYESIVRDDQHLNHIRQYIFNNPQKWQNNPENKDKISQTILVDFLF